MLKTEMTTIEFQFMLGIHLMPHTYHNVYQHFNIYLILISSVCYIYNFSTIHAIKKLIMKANADSVSN